MRRLRPEVDAIICISCTGVGRGEHCLETVFLENFGMDGISI